MLQNQDFAHPLYCAVLQYGEEAVKEGMGGGGGGGGMADIFDLFGGGGGGRRQTRERRGDNVTHRLKTSLEEMYTGALRCSLLSNPRPFDPAFHASSAELQEPLEPQAFGFRLLQDHHASFFQFKLWHIKAALC